MQRFYISEVSLWEDFSLKKSHEIYHQLTKVLRVQLGDEVIFFDGVKQQDFNYKISNISASELGFEYIWEIEKNTENNYKLSLYQALPNKLSKLEYIVQKWVEIGYNKFVFFRSERSQKLVLSDKKIERLQKIITEAVEQSGRNSVPELQVSAGNEYLRSINSEDINILFHTNGASSQALTPTLSQWERGQNVNIFVWPEGWFSASEVENFESLWYKKTYLGDRILRCETVSSVVWFFISQTKG